MAIDVALAERAFRHGLQPSPLSAQSIKHDAGQGLLMSFTNVPEKSAPDIAAALRRALASRPLAMTDLNHGMAAMSPHLA